MKTALLGLLVSFLLPSIGCDWDKAPAQDKSFKVIISAREGVPSQLPPSYLEFLDPKSPKFVLEKEDVLPDGFMFWSFYGGTIDPANKGEKDKHIYFFAMNADHIRPMMLDLENLEANLIKKLRETPAGILVGPDKLKQLDKRVGDKIKTMGINYAGIDLEFEIVGELPFPRYKQSAFMNYGYLKKGFEDYEKRTKNAHPLAAKCLNIVWLRVPNMAAYERSRKLIENAVDFKSTPLKCNSEPELRAEFKGVFPP
jgi:hypothetical protein